MKTNHIKVKLPNQKIAAFCRRHHIRKLAVFGSVLREDFRPDSDLDVLVEFETGHTPGLIRLAGMIEPANSVRPAPLESPVIGSKRRVLTSLKSPVR